MPSAPSAKDSRHPDGASAKRASARRTPAASSSESTSAQAGLDAPSGLNLAMSDPGSASPASLLALQRKMGNRAVSRLIQPKLSVGAANDKYEQEADQVARQVMTRSNPSVQRPGLEGEEDVQRKPLARQVSRLVQRHALPPKKTDDEEKEKEEEEDGSVQRQAASPNAEGGFEANAQVEQKLASQAGHGQALPGAVQRDMEGHFGAHFGGVRVHTGAEAVQLNRDLSAQAFTHGQDIYFGAGKYDPAASAGKQLLAHELTHVVQQTGASQIATQRIQRLKTPRQWWKAREKKKQESSYNIRMGQELPESETMAGDLIKGRLGEETTRKEEYTKNSLDSRANAQALPLGQGKMNDDLFMQAVFIKYNARFQEGSPAKATDAMLTDVTAYLKNRLPTATDLSAGLSLVKDDVKAKYKPAGPPIALANQFQTEVMEEARAQAAQTPGPAPDPIYGLDQKYLKGDSETATKSFLAIRKTYEMNDAYLPDDQRTAFAAALKQMPTIAVLLNPKASGAGFRQNVGWKDKGNLVDKVMPVNDLSKAKQMLAKGRMNSRSFREKVNTVDRLTRIMVEAELLNQVPRPTLHMHATAAIGFTTPWGFRAHASPGHVHVSYDESMDVIAHEVGHAIEAYLPLERWHDIHMMLGLRHQAAGGGKARAGATPLITTLSEGRYAGKYVTGKYTSTAYKDGNAEVISMAMQYLTKPAQALKLVEGDPQHAAIVLRSFRPREYQATDALRPFDKYIPHKKKAPGLPPKPSPEKLKMMKARATHRNKPLPPIPVKDKD